MWWSSFFCPVTDGGFTRILSVRSQLLCRLALCDLGKSHTLCVPRVLVRGKEEGKHGFV
jgi:hypothetical protein